MLVTVHPPTLHYLRLFAVSADAVVVEPTSPRMTTTTMTMSRSVEAVAPVEDDTDDHNTVMNNILVLDIAAGTVVA